MNSTTEKRLRLHALGLEVVPATLSKEVFVDNWTALEITEEVIGSWEKRPDWPNTGMRTAKFPALDLDIRHPEAVAACQRLVKHWFAGQGELLSRVGMAPKRLIPFRTSAPFKKRKLWYTAPDGSKQAIEFLGDGQQEIIDGFHQEAGKPYAWENDRDPEMVPPEKWPEICELEADELLTELDDLLVDDFGFERTAPPGAANGNGYSSAAYQVTDVEAALADLDYCGKGGGGNTHDILFGCINRRIADGIDTSAAVEEMLAAFQAHAATNPLCARLDWNKIRHRMEKAAYSFVSKFPEYAPMLPNYLLDGWARQLNAGNLAPKILYDKQRGWFVEGEPAIADAPQSVREAPAAKKKRFQLVPFCDLRPGPDPTCIVEDLIPLHGIVCVWGKPKCLKTFWVYDLCFHVARGLEYRGRRVRQGSVVYCAFEGAHGFNARAEALRRCHGLADDAGVPIYLVPGRADLIKEYMQLVIAIQDELAGKDLPVIIVLDTLNKSLVGSENKPEDMAGYVRAAEAIREAFNCVVIIVHHCGWDDSHPRGHSSLPGAVDAELSVVRSEKLVTVTVQLMKDGPEGVEIRSEVESVDVGIDDNGKVLTSLIVLPAEMPAGVATKGGRPEKNMPVFLKAMRAALLAHGEPFRPVGGNALERAVRLDEVRKLFYRWYAGGEATEKDDNAASQKAFKRCLEAAVSGGTVVKDVNPKGQPMLFFVAGKA